MKFATIYRSVIAYATPLLLATSCTVYAPMQPTISTISGQGQAEISGSVQVSGRVEGGVTYSPLPNLLVMAAGTFRPDFGRDSTISTTRQWEAGVGGYVPLGHRWQLTGLVGYGHANTHKAYAELDVISGWSSLENYQARYSKTFGQLSITREFGRGSFGAAYRLSRISFDELNYASGTSRYPVALRRMTRHEPLLFARVSLDAYNRWQLQGTMGLSVAADAKQDVTNNPELYQANHTLLPIPMASLGVVFRPQLFGKNNGAHKPETPRRN
ncbi:hypothetical protein [Hymenobacter lucidus]|uniref:Outer membrane protein beta-barrel domain-containing protein n=1 Tax=Hymenobacter lucidus TaxID=2880930 RepID=A0ABS8ATV5_9BACT|nr:hypothetical protein [Hymenobacter lucidus]MCB2409665.1 hypothetical protein [Hymenobacter lucidus]